MTVASTVRRNVYNYIAGQTVFPFTFPVLEKSHIEVYRLPTGQTSPTLLVNGVDYNVFGEGLDAGGNVTLAAPTVGTGTLTIIRVVPLTQPTDFKNQGSFFPRTHERAFDRVTMLAQQIAETLSRSLTLPIDATAVDTELPLPQPGALLGWDSGDLGIRNFTPQEIATTVAFGNFRYDRFTATPGQAAFTLAADPGAIGNLDVSIGGVTRVPIDDYTVSGTTLTLTSPLTGGQRVLVRYGTAAGATDASVMTWQPAGVGSVQRTVQDKMREWVSVKDFGAVGDWNGTQSVLGTGTDDTAAIQAAIDYCLQAGTALFFPPGRYRTTAPLVIDRTFNTQDPINGGMYGISLRGGGAASCQIASDHNGACIDFRGGLGAGWHSYFYIDGLGVLKADYARNVGSIGFKFNQAAYVQIQRFDTYGFEYGIYGIDVLSSAFMDGTIRGNQYGFRFERGTRSHPNNISFRGVQTLNNITYGGALYSPSVFSYIGGSIESNGYTGILADPNSWGLYVESAGTEGSVGINMQGVYLENNNGKADVWILQTTNNVIHNFNGCSFLRFLDTRYATNCILFNSINDSRLSINGCGFKDYAPYVSDASRRWIATGDAKVFDGGGNLFHDTTGGFVGLAPEVFAPIATNHQLPFVALPSATEFRNGIIYCQDGGGGTTHPALAVSDGAKWWQIVLGQFAGNVASEGVAQTLPRGWTSSKAGAGIYTITHNLGLSANSYAVVATPRGGPSAGYCSGWVLSSNTFEIYFSNPAGAMADMGFSFILNII